VNQLLVANTRTEQQLEAIEAVERAKKSEFGVTAVKVELEANLYRQWNDAECYAYLMERLAELGLAEERDEDNWLEFERHSVEYCSNWHPRGDMTFAMFYNDGSVDSEFTFTLMLNNSENILLLPKIIDIWNDFCTEAGDSQDVSGAGMHTAFLHSRDGSYPTQDRTGENENKFVNFKKSMGLLLPALYFLGASRQESRGMEYRNPSIGVETHRSAVDWRGGALEFRVFDTCYDNPAQIFDNIIVMANCMKFWSSKFVPSGMDKICSSVKFGRDNGRDLDRFYTTTTHIDLLNAGLNKLKPEYLTIKQIKAQRGFKKTKRLINTEEARLTKQVTTEYGEYADRYEWQIKAKKADLFYLRYDQRAKGEIGLSEQEIRAMVEKDFKVQMAPKQSVNDYTKQRIQEWKSTLEGRYTLTA